MLLLQRIEPIPICVTICIPMICYSIIFITLLSPTVYYTRIFTLHEHYFLYECESVKKVNGKCSAVRFYSVLYENFIGKCRGE